MSFLERPLPTLFHPAARRERAFEAFARQEGLGFSPDDPIGLVDPALQIFRVGRDPRCTNVVWGTWQGLTVAAADLWFAREKQAEYGPGYSVAEVQLEQDVALPGLTISRGKPPMELRSIPPIEFESGEFNRLFQVRCRDREFAFQLVDVQMMEWLVATKDGFGYQVGGRRCLVHSHRLAPEALIPLIASAKAFHDHVPRLVLTDYARPGPGPAVGEAAEPPEPPPASAAGGEGT